MRVAGGDALPCVVILSRAFFPLNRRNSIVRPARRRARGENTAELRGAGRGKTGTKQ